MVYHVDAWSGRRFAGLVRHGRHRDRASLRRAQETAHTQVDRAQIRIAGPADGNSKAIS